MNHSRIARTLIWGVPALLPIMASSVSAEVLRIAELDTEQIRALVEGNAAFRTNTGETFDFLWAPGEPGEATLSFGFENLFEPGELILRQALRVV